MVRTKIDIRESDYTMKDKKKLTEEEIIEIMNSFSDDNYRLFIKDITVFPEK